MKDIEGNLLQVLAVLIFSGFKRSRKDLHNGFNSGLEGERMLILMLMVCESVARSFSHFVL